MRQKKQSKSQVLNLLTRVCNTTQQQDSQLPKVRVPPPSGFSVSKNWGFVARNCSLSINTIIMGKHFRYKKNPAKTEA